MGHNGVEAEGSASVSQCLSVGQGAYPIFGCSAKRAEQCSCMPVAVVILYKCVGRVTLFGNVSVYV